MGSVMTATVGQVSHPHSSSSSPHHHLILTSSSPPHLILTSSSANRHHATLSQATVSARRTAATARVGSWMARFRQFRRWTVRTATRHTLAATATTPARGSSRDLLWSSVCFMRHCIPARKRVSVTLVSTPHHILTCSLTSSSPNPHPSLDSVSPHPHLILIT